MTLRRLGVGRPIALAVTLALASAACGSSAGSAGTSAGPNGSVASAVTAASGSPAAGSASAPPGTFTNPVLQQDFPDPFVLADGGSYYAYATTDGAQHLQLARSDDLVSWDELHDPLPTLPRWSTGDTWAPEVAKTSAGYVLYYTAHDSDLKRPDGNGSQCITLATADKPDGPFVDSSSKPLVCQVDKGGSIDATAFRDDDGQRYLIWKNDGNCCHLPTRFTIQRLSGDGLHLTGQPIDLGVSNDKPWEGGVIEAPTLLHHAGTYYLFYSANDYDSELYAVGYATSKRVTGPYADAQENPILASAWGHPATSRARGPGHQSVVSDEKGRLWMAYHAWDESAVGYASGGMRELWIDPLVFDGGKALVKGPTDGPEPAP